jgi:hypothetical protein
MRPPLFILGIGVGVVGIGNRAEAQNYPWCAYYGGDGDGGGTRLHDLSTMSRYRERDWRLLPAQ